MNIKLMNAALVTGLAMSFALAQTQSACAQFCQYEVTIVFAPPCGIIGPQGVSFYGINEYGQACGFQGKCAGDNTGGVPQPIVWTPELGTVVLPLPEGATEGIAYDINNVLGSDGIGQVVCTLIFPSIAGYRGYLYDDGEWTELSPSSGSYSEANAIDDTGRITGSRTTPTGWHGFRWDSGNFTEIISPIGGVAIGYDINELGNVAGRLYGPDHAYWWDGERVSDLGTMLGGDGANARALDSHDRLAGIASLPVQRGQQFGDSRAFMWDDGMVVNLGVLPGTQHSRGDDINDAGQIVGKCVTQNFGQRPFIWQSGAMVRLDDIIEDVPGLLGLLEARAINNRGQIAGQGSFQNQGGVGIILTPIDRPLGDIDIDCDVDATDLAMVLGDWGTCAHPGACVADIVTSETFQPPGDGVVDGADLAVVLGNWSPQPLSQTPNEGASRRQ